MFGYRSEHLSEGEYYCEVLQQYADVYGIEDPTQEWILTPQDVWVVNPHYIGTPGKHPEENWDDEYF